jgi:flagellar P-ring protein precursor FlgI
MTRFMQFTRTYGLILLVAAILVTAVRTTYSEASVRLKDVAHLAGSGSTALFGYSLVVGLDGTGDGQGTGFTVQTLTNMLLRMGVTVDPSQVKVKNVAAVMVTATLTPQMVRGERFDVTVSSMGDAKSLRGGTLIMTPLSAREGTIHAFAQGPVSTGGFAVEAGGGGASVSRNYNLVGRVPGGGTVEAPMFQLPADPMNLELILHSPDWTTAHRMAEAIRTRWGDIAEARQPSVITVMIPDSCQAAVERAQFIAALEAVEIEPDQAARVVINEKTGTIVAGEHVSIAPVAIAHGGITVEIQNLPVISQPAPFSDGETVVEQESGITVEEESAHVVYVPGTGTIKDVAESLNAIGATPRDIIAIFQALKEAGALRAELVIL